MEVSGEYIRVICLARPDVTPDKSGLQVYMPAYILQIDVHSGENVICYLDGWNYG